MMKIISTIVRMVSIVSLLFLSLFFAATTCFSYVHRTWVPWLYCFITLWTWIMSLVYSRECLPILKKINWIILLNHGHYTIDNDRAKGLIYTKSFFSNCIILKSIHSSDSVSSSSTLVLSVASFSLSWFVRSFLFRLLFLSLGIFAIPLYFTDDCFFHSFGDTRQLGIFNSFFISQSHYFFFCWLVYPRTSFPRYTPSPHTLLR